MPARTGQQYIDGLRAQEREIWLGGERVRDVTRHKGLSGGVKAIASLYDMQHDPKLKKVMTYKSPTSGDRVGRSFSNPKTREELETRTSMMLNWARTTNGMMGRSPDFMNVTFAAWGAAADFFGEKRPEFGDNMRRYVEHLRENDVCLTHALINLQRSRNVSGMFNLEEGTALEVKKETSAGVVVHGARILATLGPLSDEIAVYSPRLARHSEAHSTFAMSFSIDCGTPGLKFMCRDSFDLGRSHFDAPLASRFEEMDSVVIFDHVLIPWDRVFLCGDVARCNGLYGETNAVVNMMHQVVVKDVVKSEFMLGLAASIAEASDAMTLPHVRERLAEMIMTTEVMRACLRAAEADAAPDRWGQWMPARAPLDTARNLFPRLYPRLVEIVQLNSSSSLMATPSEADFASALLPEIERYFATAGALARDRVALYRLAWDVAGSAFGGRQTLYERFFFGDPVRMASALVDNTDLKPLIARVTDFLKRPD
ncbi:MAG TPA: 4-hydroxyphenylacetate 3-monooxygenase, oxygenase component [Candidatus Binataceae bacterium]